MAYGTEAGVEAINAHFIGGYTTSTTPSAAQVAGFLADGYAALNLRLAYAGYSVPVLSSASVYGVLTRLNNLYAAACAEEAQNISASLEPEARSAMLWARYQNELDALLSGDLTLVGAARNTAAPARRRIRSLPLRRYDGYALAADDDSASSE